MHFLSFNVFYGPRWPLHWVEILGFLFVKYVCNVTCLVHFLYLLSTIFYNDCNSLLLRLCEQIFNNQDDLNSLSILFSTR